MFIDMKIKNQQVAAPAIITDEQLKKLAQYLASYLIESGFNVGGSASFPTSLPARSSVKMDESIVDVGVSLDGIEASGPIGKTTTTTDDTSSAMSKLKNLKKK